MRGRGVVGKLWQRGEDEAGSSALVLAYVPKSLSPRALPKAGPLGRGVWVRMHSGARLPGGFFELAFIFQKLL